MGNHIALAHAAYSSNPESKVHVEQQTLRSFQAIQSYLDAVAAAWSRVIHKIDR